MFKISYSPDLRGEVLISGSKNAALPIIAANYLIDQQIQLENKPDISDVRSIEKLAEDQQVNKLLRSYLRTRNQI